MHYSSLFSKFKGVKHVKLKVLSMTKLIKVHGISSGSLFSKLNYMGFRTKAFRRNISLNKGRTPGRRDSSDHWWLRLEVRLAFFLELCLGALAFFLRFIFRTSSS